MDVYDLTNRTMIAIVALLQCCGIAAAQTDKSKSGKYALLVGCSHYEYQNGADLKGPPNDVREMSNALTTRFGFQVDAVRQLVGWPDDPTERPTRENILREFSDLERRIQPNSHVVVYLSGHGLRLPIPTTQTSSLDPKNPELDGYDEAFVAADAQYADGALKNLIRDDEIGERLNALRAKGAHVWALFDCCHSGTMSRGVDEEQPRELMAKDLGISAEEIQRADNLTISTSSADTQSGLTEGLVDSSASETLPGTLVAFYAAQPFETAPDLRCPRQAPDLPENYFGLMTYTTLQSLLQQRDNTQVTYRELGQMIANRYRAERGTRGPTPTFSGDLDHEVLGVQRWPSRSKMTLRKESDAWVVNSGELQGLAAGSILEVRSPGADTQDIPPLGYLQVTHVNAIFARVEPCEYNQHPAIPAEQLKDLMPCQVVERHLGDLRVRLAVREAEAELRPVEDVARGAMAKLSKPVAEFVDVCQSHNLDQAEWELIAVSPPIAMAHFGLKIQGPRLILTRHGETGGEGAVSASSLKDEKLPMPLGRVYQSYDPQNFNDFQSKLEADLLKIFTWQNLWRISGRMSGELVDPRSAIKVELTRPDQTDNQSGGPPSLEFNVVSGEPLELRIKNDSADKLWITLVFLNSNFLIDVLPTQQLNLTGSEGDSLPPIRFNVNSRRGGVQAWLVIASSAEADRLEPDYYCLSQPGLGDVPKKVNIPVRDSITPFESLTRAISGQTGAFRGAGLPPGSNPTLVLRSWNVVTNSTSKP